MHQLNEPITCIIRITRRTRIAIIICVDKTIGANKLSGAEINKSYNSQKCGVYKGWFGMAISQIYVAILSSVLHRRFNYFFRDSMTKRL